jgi:hypothetical protein
LVPVPVCAVKEMWVKFLFPVKNFFFFFITGTGTDLFPVLGFGFLKLG